MLELELKLKITEHARERWWHEDSLVHNRLTWLLQSQVILFASYGLIARIMVKFTEKDIVHLSNMESSESVKPSINNELSDKITTELNQDALLNLDALLNALPWMGLAICLIIYISVNAAWEAQRKLQDEYSTIQLGVHEKTSIGGRISGYCLPLIFFLGWGWLLKGGWGMLTCILFAVLIYCLVYIFFATDSIYKRLKNRMDHDHELMVESAKVLFRRIQNCKTKIRKN